jgi:proteasome lid subunit RPN8/RPN11
LSTPFRLQLPRAIYEEMVAHARAELPNECCGLLAGKIIIGQSAQGFVEKRYSLVNQAASPTEYLSGVEQVHAQKDMRLLDIRELAVYHSHPTTAPIPSRKDLERNTRGTVAMHLIISLAGTEVQMRGWWLEETAYREAEWEIMA